MESIYRREKLRCFFTFRWGRKRRTKDESKGDMPLNCCSANSTSQVEEEKSLTRTLVRDKKLQDYAVIVFDLCKAYDNSNVVRGIDFAVKQGLYWNFFRFPFFHYFCFFFLAQFKEQKFKFQYIHIHSR